MKILVVEDDPFVADDLVAKLEELDHEVVAIVDSHDRALEVADAHRLDLVLLDIDLKGDLDGIDLGRQLALQDIPFIYLTGIRAVETYLEARDSKPADYLAKPVDKYNLRNAILEVALTRMNKIAEPELHVFVDKDKNEVRFYPNDILYVKAGRTYCDVYFAETMRTLNVPMKTFLEKLRFRPMVRIGKSHTINLNHYVRQEGSEVVLSNDVRLRVTNKTQLDLRSEKYR